MDTILALPAFNEEQALPSLFARVRDLDEPTALTRIVVVDDGSADRTREIVESWSSSLPIDLVSHTTNCGLGQTILHALERAVALAAPNDAIVTMDADNSHSPALMHEMVQKLEGGFDIVIASRYRPGSSVVGLSGFRHLMSYGARILFQSFFPIPGVRDYTSGFRAYRASFLKDAFLRYGDGFVTERSFACMAEILLNSAKLGARVTEIPMVLRYDEKGGASKMRVCQTVFRTLRLMARNWIASPFSARTSGSL